MANFYATLTPSTPTLELTDGFDAQIFDAGGTQTINLHAGASLDLDASTGDNTISFQGKNISDYTVSGDGAGNMTFTDKTSGNTVEFTANQQSQTQQLNFADGSLDITVNDSNDVVLLGEAGTQVVTEADGSPIELAPSGDYDETVDLDQLGGTAQSSVDYTADAGTSYKFTDDAETQNFVDITGYSDDDAIEFQNATEDDINYSYGDDTTLTITQDDGTVSDITLMGVSSSLGDTVADLPGDITFG